MNLKVLQSEITYKATRSSGAGGQHVNKVSSKVILYFNILSSDALSENEKNRLLNHFKSKVNSEGVLQLSSEESRSQFRNKALVTARFIDLIAEGLKVKKVRHQTKPKRSAIVKAKKTKQQHSEKKARRSKPGLNE